MHNYGHHFLGGLPLHSLHSVWCILQTQNEHSLLKWSTKFSSVPHINVHIQIYIRTVYMFASMYSNYYIWRIHCTKRVEQTGQTSTMTTLGAFSLQCYHVKENPPHKCLIFGSSNRSQGSWVVNRICSPSVGFLKVPGTSAGVPTTCCSFGVQIKQIIDPIKMIISDLFNYIYSYFAGFQAVLFIQWVGFKGNT